MYVPFGFAKKQKSHRNSHLFASEFCNFLGKSRVGKQSVRFRCSNRLSFFSSIFFLVLVLVYSFVWVRLEYQMGTRGSALKTAFPDVQDPQSLKQEALASKKLINPRYIGLPARTPEEFEFDFLGRFDSKCSPSCLYMDVGTNKGQALFPILNATQNVNVIAFEPNQEMCEFVRRKANTEYPGRIRIHCKGVGSSRGQQTFSKEASSSASYRMVDSNKSKNTVTVEIETVDSVTDGAHILLLKSDTQGFEKEVLLGSKNTFLANKITFIIVEISYSLLRLQKTNETEILDLIYSWGYSCSFLAWHGITSKGKGAQPSYGILPSPEFPGAFVGFDEFSHFLGPKGNPSGKATWTDIICF